MSYKRALTLNADSSILSTLTCTFFHTDLTYLAFNSAILYTIGNYHVLKYGTNHFLRLNFAAALAGAAFTAYNIKTNEHQYLAGGIPQTGALIAYNVFKNPAWFKYGLNPISLLSLFVLYGAFYNDRAATAGVATGYLAFLIGL